MGSIPATLVIINTTSSFFTAKLKIKNNKTLKKPYPIKNTRVLTSTKSGTSFFDKVLFLKKNQRNFFFTKKKRLKKALKKRIRKKKSSNTLLFLRKSPKSIYLNRKIYNFLRWNKKSVPNRHRPNLSVYRYLFSKVLNCRLVFHNTRKALIGRQSLRGELKFNFKYKKAIYTRKVVFAKKLTYSVNFVSQNLNHLTNNNSFNNAFFLKVLALGNFYPLNLKPNFFPNTANIDRLAILTKKYSISIN